MLKKVLVGEVAHPFKANSQAKSTPDQYGAGAFVPFESKGVFSQAPAPKGPFIHDDELRARYGDAAELLIDALDRKVETQKAANHSRDRAAVEAAIKARCL
jgi:hypothetical protein